MPSQLNEVVITSCYYAGYAVLFRVRRAKIVWIISYVSFVPCTVSWHYEMSTGPNLKFTDLIQIYGIQWQRDDVSARNSRNTNPYLPSRMHRNQPRRFARRPCVVSFGFRSNLRIKSRKECEKCFCRVLHCAANLQAEFNFSVVLRVAQVLWDRAQQCFYFCKRGTHKSRDGGKIVVENYCYKEQTIQMFRIWKLKYGMNFYFI